MADDAQEPAATRAERVALIASTIFLFVSPFAASAGWRATCLIVAVLAIAVSGAWRAALRAPLPLPLVGALVAWFLLAPLSLAWSSDPSHSREELRAETFYGLLAFGIFFLLATDTRRWRRWWIAIIAGTMITLAAKLVQQNLGIALWRHSPDGGAGAFSTHLVLVAPLLVALVCPAPWGFQRKPWVLAAALVLLMAAAWSTRDAWAVPNRVVWLALLAVLLAAVLAGRKTANLGLQDPCALRRVIGIGAVAILMAFAAAVAAKNERFFSNDPSSIASIEKDLRPRLWSVGLEQWSAAPWLGHGIGREIRAQAFLPETPVGVDHPAVRHGHNALLNIALQLGIVGLATFVAILLLLAREYVRYLADVSIAPLGVMGLALLAGFVAKNLTDDFLHRHNAQVFWALNAMLVGLACRARRR